MSEEGNKGIELIGEELDKVFGNKYKDKVAKKRRSRVMTIIIIILKIIFFPFYLLCLIVLAIVFASASTLDFYLN